MLNRGDRVEYTQVGGAAFCPPVYATVLVYFERVAGDTLTSASAELDLRCGWPRSSYSSVVPHAHIRADEWWRLPGHDTPLGFVTAEASRLRRLSVLEVMALEANGFRSAGSVAAKGD